MHCPVCGFVCDENKYYTGDSTTIQHIRYVWRGRYWCISDYRKLSQHTVCVVSLIEDNKEIEEGTNILDGVIRVTSLLIG